MIINDTHQFAFIHVPKCAGTTLRNALQSFDETYGAHTNRVDYHPNLGQIDYVHIPLFVLREYFAEEYAKIKDYRTYAMLRDPFARFPSSFSQYVRFYGKALIQDLKPSEIKRELDFVIRVLQKHSGDWAYLPFKYIHFQRQRDFIYDQGERLVDHVYEVVDIDVMLGDIGTRLGTSLKEGQEASSVIANQAVVYRNRLLKAMYGAGRVALRPFLSVSAKTSLAEAAHNLVYVPRRNKLQDIFESDYVRDFVSAYYACDIELHQGIRSDNIRSHGDLR